MAHVKFIISRSCGIGEQMQAEVTVNTAQDIFEQLAPVHQAFDKRIWQKNLWMAAHVKSLRALPKETYLGVIECIDILHGQRQIPDYLLKEIEQNQGIPGPEELVPAEGE